MSGLSRQNTWNQTEYTFLFFSASLFFLSCRPLSFLSIFPFLPFPFTRLRRVARLDKPDVGPFNTVVIMSSSISPLPPTVQRILNIYLNNLPAVFATRYVAAAALVIVLYDWLLNLGDEVRLIYPGRRSMVKMLYIIIRVSTLIGLIVVNYRLAGFRPPLSNFICQLMSILIPTLQILVIAISNFLLMRRVGPLYGNSWKVVYGLHFLFLISYVATIALSMDLILGLLPGTRYDPLSDCCFTLSTPTRPIAIIYLGPLLLETVVFLMTMYKAYKAARSTAAMPRILQVFFRDGLIHYFGMLTVRVFCIVITFELPLAYGLLGVYLLWAIVTTMTTRLFINFRAVGNKEVEATWGNLPSSDEASELRGREPRVPV